MIRPDRSLTRLGVLCAELVALLLAFCPTQAQPTGDAQKRAAVQEALTLYIEGLIAQDASRIPLASDVIFVEPDGSGETNLEDIG